MLTLEELWRRLVDLDETVQLEAKIGEQIGPSILETISAFSNEPGRGGGYMLLGVRPIADSVLPRYDIVGVSDPDRVQSALATQCRTQFNKPIRPKISVESRDGNRVVIVFIPEAEPHDKPIYLSSRGLPKGAYRRIGSTDQRCTEDDLSVFFQGRGIKAADETVFPDGELSELDLTALSEYRAARARLSPSAAELGCSDEGLLHSLGAASRHTGHLRPTLAGLILFGKASAIRRHFPAMRVDYIRVPGREWVKSPEERFESVDILAPLMLTIPRAINAVLDDIPKSFRLPANSHQREDVPLVPRTAVREAIVNAVMHRSYRQNQPVQIIRYSNRLEVRNPGVSLVPDDRLGEPGSMQRNPRIAAVLHDSGFAETKGSGIRAIREAMAQANLSPPTFESDRDKDGFVVTFLFHHILSEEDVAWLGHFKHLGLSEDEQRALVYAREVGAINNAAYRDLNRVETLVASGHLRRLRDQGLLGQHGKGSATYYRPTERLVSPAIPTSAALPEGLSPSGNAQPTELKRNLQGLPTGLAVQIEAIGRRARPADIRGVIVELCRWRPQTSEQLAKLLGRNQHYVITSLLRPMVKEGVLVLLFPDIPAHPQQAYGVPGRGGAPTGRQSCSGT